MWRIPALVGAVLPSVAGEIRSACARNALARMVRMGDL